MPTLSEQVHAHFLALPIGSLVRAEALLHLGKLAAVQRVLRQAVQSQTLVRIGRGNYARPVHSRFGSRGPNPNEIVERLLATTSEVIVSTGATCANALRLSTQVPCGYAYYTSGRTRKMVVGKFNVTFTHVPAWLLLAPYQPAGMAVRALECVGPAGAASALSRIKRLFTPEHFEELVALGPQLPSWLAQALAEVQGAPGAVPPSTSRD